MITPSFSLTSSQQAMPKLVLDFTTASLDSRVTFSRALNTATCVNSSGDVVTSNADLPRFDYDPITLVCKGLLIEESRTNSIKNNTMAGAVSGTPGTIPTYWSYITPGGGLVRTLGTGVENGISYIDITVSGTATQTNAIAIGIENGNAISASTGQTWTNSVYCKLVSGSLSGITTNLNIIENTSSGGYVTAGGVSISPTSASLITQRFSYTKTLSGGATVGAVQPTMQFNCAIGASVNFTIRIGLPQLEQGAFATSVIKTTTAAATRNADVATMTGTNFSSWFNATQGAIYSTFIPAFPSTLATGVYGPLQIDDGTTSNRIQIRISDAVGVRGLFQVAGAPTFLGGAAFPANTTLNAGISFKNTSNIMYVNANGNGTSANNVPSGLANLRIGSEGNAATTFTGIIKKISFYPQRLTNNETQAFSK